MSVDHRLHFKKAAGRAQNIYAFLSCLFLFLRGVKDDVLFKQRTYS
nr:MAG TPA: hypothetical protein [Herelleviridae sp.]